MGILDDDSMHSTSGEVERGIFNSFPSSRWEREIQKKESHMGKGGCRPPNGPSTTGNPSGGGRGNCSP
ncbi:MAG: hypothetical protein QG567_1886 [Campylobacterota bacterium]|nr:hypothetical protein [Campylobacterota bacterium]